VIVSGNTITDNGYFHSTGLLGNGITVQSTNGLIGDKLYITKNVVVTANVISGSAKDGIQFKLTESCSASSNIITAAEKKTCVNVRNTSTTFLQFNSCDGGIPLKESGNVQLLNN
jgi:nitrous oxidase accessory protein NosD